MKHTTSWPGSKLCLVMLVHSFISSLLREKSSYYTPNSYWSLENYLWYDKISVKMKTSKVPLAMSKHILGAQPRDGSSNLWEKKEWQSSLKYRNRFSLKAMRPHSIGLLHKLWLYFSVIYWGVDEILSDMPKTLHIQGLGGSMAFFIESLCKPVSENWMRYRWSLHARCHQFIVF